MEVMTSPVRNMPSSTQLQNYPEDAQGFGYQPEWGLYTSSFVFRGDFTNDLKLLQENYGYKPLQVTQQFDNQVTDRDLGTIISSIAFRSSDGTVHTHRHPGDVDETPELFQYTPAYYDMTTIRNIIDWFGDSVCRCRIFRQEPGKDLPMHYDFDNERNSFDNSNQTLRVWMQLTPNTDNWMRLMSKTSDITLRPTAGQAIIFNADWVWHGTVNYVDTPRDCLMLILKDQNFAMNLGKRFPSHKIEFIDV